MLHKRILAFSFLFILYNLCIGYNTLYGLNKSVFEYFCIQKRPDNVDYRSQFTPGWVGTTVFNSRAMDPLTGMDYDFISPAKGRIFGYNYFNFSRSRDCTDEHCESIYNPIVDFGPGFTLTYDKLGSYFRLECNALETWIDLNETEYMTKSPGFEVDPKGFISEQNFISLSTMVNETKLTIMSCIFEKSPETCSMKKETEDNFAVLFVVWSCSLSILFILLTAFERLNSSMVSRWAQRVSDYVKALTDSRILFCNPMDGLPKEIKEGQMFWTMTENQFDEDDFPYAYKVNGVEDLNGSYKFVNETTLLMSIKNPKRNELIRLSHSQAESVKNYFFMIMLSPDNCVSDPESKHYFKTRDVIYMVKNNYFFCRGVSKKNTYCMSVEESEISPIMATFMLDETRAYKALVHNKKFFGYYNVDALVNCLKSKMKFWDRPSSVKNSQWKWYTSDFCKLMNKGGDLNYKSQCNWRSSKALEAAEKSEVEIIPPQGNYVVNLPVGEKGPEQNKEIKVKEILSRALDVINSNSSTLCSLDKTLKMKGDGPIEAAIRGSLNVLKEAKILKDRGSSLKLEEVRGMKAVDFPTVREIFKGKSEDLIKGAMDLVTNMDSYKDILLSDKRIADPKVEKRIKEIKSMIIREEGKPEGRRNERRISFLKDDINSEMRNCYKDTPYSAPIREIKGEISSVLKSFSINIVSYGEVLEHLDKYEKHLEDDSPPETVECNLSVEKLWKSVEKSIYVSLGKSPKGNGGKRTRGGKAKWRREGGVKNGKKGGKKRRKERNERKSRADDCDKDEELEGSENAVSTPNKEMSANSQRVIKVKRGPLRMKNWAKSDFKAVVRNCVDYINNSYWIPECGVKKRSVFSMKNKIINFLELENKDKIKTRSSDIGCNSSVYDESIISIKIEEAKNAVTKSRIMGEKAEEVYKWLKSKTELFN